MYQLFKITLKRKEINLEVNLNNIRSLGWYPDGLILEKDDGGLQYILDLSVFMLKCTMSELFPLEEGKWLPEDLPSREELVNSAITQLKKLPFNLEVDHIERVVKHE